MLFIKRMRFLKAAENRESFFKRISEFYPKLDPRYQAIERAYNSAKDAFSKRFRESGERYFEHLRAVALILIDYLRVRDHELIIAALLHDIVEDIPFWSVDRVMEEFGKRVAFLVDWLTKPPKSKYGGSKEKADKIYHDRFQTAPREFFLIKLADRLHNLITLWACSKEKRTRKIEETKRYYLPYAIKEIILIQELEEVIAHNEAKIKRDSNTRKRQSE